MMTMIGSWLHKKEESRVSCHAEWRDSGGVSGGDRGGGLRRVKEDEAVGTRGCGGLMDDVLQ